ncbi:MAG: S41 family peptidase [Planctomycetota bacterium]|jgi:carboxyl-terminal processing protease
MHKHHLTWIGIFSIITLMFLRLPPMVAKEDSVLNTYRALVEVDALAKQHYVERIDDDRLVDGAIRGMMLQLDPYSGYIAPDELLQYERRHAGDYIGLGIEVGMTGGQPTVIAAIEGSPAAGAGVLAQDRILAIDRRDVEGLSVFDVEDLLEGRRDTILHLTVLHPGSDEPTDLAIKRGPVSITTVRGFRRDRSGTWDYLIDPKQGIGYIRVSNFQENTMRGFDAALEKLLDAGMGSLIVDLRFNPGGIVDQAVDMVDRFVESGVIVSTVTRRRAVREYFATRASPPFHGGVGPVFKRATIPRALDRIKIAVLINGATASAAEIVSGSLQDHGRALVIGERSFGKGSVQSIMHLASHEAAVKVTIAYYRLPGGRLLHRTAGNEHTDSWGVTPDVEVVLSDDEVKAIQQSREALDAGMSVEVTDQGHDPGGSRRAGTSGTHPMVGLEIVRDRHLIEALTRLGDEPVTSTADAQPTGL